MLPIRKGAKYQGIVKTPITIWFHIPVETWFEAYETFNRRNERSGAQVTFTFKPLFSNTEPSIIIKQLTEPQWSFLRVSSLVEKVG